VKRTTVLIPMSLPKLSDHAAVQLMDVLEQLRATAHHHYAPQIHRWRRRQCQPATVWLREAQTRAEDDEPF
jgi:hypothetical protein